MLSLSSGEPCISKNCLSTVRQYSIVGKPEDRNPALLHFISWPNTSCWTFSYLQFPYQQTVDIEFFLYHRDITEVIDKLKWSIMMANIFRVRNNILLFKGFGLWHFNIEDSMQSLDFRHCSKILQNYSIELIAAMITYILPTQNGC